jgi:hypothetical protein
MKKILLTIAVAMALCFSTCAQTTKVVTDSVTFYPQNVEIFEGVSKKGNPKYWIELPTEDGKTRKVSMTANHVTSRRLLALIERKDMQTGKYTYSVKFAEPKSTGARADLSSLK